MRLKRRPQHRACKRPPALHEEEYWVLAQKGACEGEDELSGRRAQLLERRVHGHVEGDRHQRQRGRRLQQSLLSSGTRAFRPGALLPCALRKGLSPTSKGSAKIPGKVAGVHFDLRRVYREGVKLINLGARQRPPEKNEFRSRLIVIKKHEGKSVVHGAHSIQREEDARRVSRRFSTSSSGVVNFVF